MKSNSLMTLVGVLATACLTPQVVAKQIAKAPTVTQGKKAPAISAPDAEGKPFNSAAFKGRAHVVFFYCGCEHCHQCATAWAQLEQAGAVKSTGNPASAIVFADGPEGAKAFAGETGVNLKTTRMVPDADMKIADRFSAPQCPRTFVVDTAGIIRYTNNHNDDQPQKAEARVIIQRTADALAAAIKRPSKGLKKP